MEMRRFRPEDGPILDRWKTPEKHGKGELELSGPQTVACMVLVDERGVPRAALRAKKCVEMTFVIDPLWESPMLRLLALRALAKEIFKTCYTCGYRTAFCWVEKAIVKAYARRLKSMGMEPDERQSFRLEAE